MFLRAFAREADEDAADVALLERGDRCAFARLYDRHAGFVFALGVRVAGDRAEELVREVFLELWHRRPALPVREWLMAGVLRRRRRS
jgi:DNA-directed RNA polymerase specialized sigma24 family protein